MKILYVAHNHPPKGAPLENIGGMQRVSMQLLKEFRKRNDIELETTILRTSWDAIGYKAPFFLYEQLFRLPHKARESGADVILFSSMVTASLAYFIKNKVDIPMITINHGQDVTLPVSAYQWFVPKVFDSLDGVISVSTATLQACRERGLPADKGVALGNGFNMKRLQHFPDKEISRKEIQEHFGIDLHDRFMMLSVGRQVKRKGHEWFIRHVLPNLRDDLIFVTIGEGPETENIKKAREESTESDRIYLLGKQPEDLLKKSYAAADLFVMPNIPVKGDMEGFGIVLLEANMAKTPAVAADLEGIKDVIINGKNGYRVPPLDEQAFVEKIHQLTCNGLAEFSEQTRIFVEQKFSWEHVAHKYIDYIEKVKRSCSEVDS